MLKQFHIKISFPYGRVGGLVPSKKLCLSKKLKPTLALMNIALYKKITFEGGEEDEKV